MNFKKNKHKWSFFVFALLLLIYSYYFVFGFNPNTSVMPGFIIGFEKYVCLPIYLAFLVFLLSILLLLPNFGVPKKHILIAIRHILIVFRIVFSNRYVKIFILSVAIGTTLILIYRATEKQTVYKSRYRF